MSRHDCAWVEAQLPLLHYGDLPAAERAEVEAHLARCSACQVARAATTATAGVLDQAPLERAPEPRASELKARVLEAVAGCPQEAELLARDELDAAALRDLDLHLSSCASCRDADAAFGRVDAALDLSPAPPLGAEARVALTERVLLATGVRCPREGELVGEPDPAHVAACAPCRDAEAAFARVGAALDLLEVPQAAGLVGLRDRVLAEVHEHAAASAKVIRFPVSLQAALQSLAAALLVSLGLAVAYELSSAERSGQPLPSTLAQAVEADASYQAEAVRSLQGVEANPSQDVLIGYEDVIVKFPGTAAARYAIKKTGAVVLGSGPASFAIDDHPRFPGYAKRNPKVLRYDYKNMHDLVNRKAFLDPGVRQSILLQQGMDAEELSVIAMREGDDTKAATLAAQAIRHYRQVIELNPDTKAAFLASEGLRRLA